MPSKNPLKGDQGFLEILLLKLLPDGVRMADKKTFMPAPGYRFPIFKGDGPVGREGEDGYIRWGLGQA
jgi:hypothetical protein